MFFPHFRSKKLTFSRNARRRRENFGDFTLKIIDFMKKIDQNQPQYPKKKRRLRRRPRGIIRQNRGGINLWVGDKPVGLD